MNVEVFFTRATSVARLIERLIQQGRTSIDAALYRFDSSRLGSTLGKAAGRGVLIRLVLDRGKYEASRATRELLSEVRVDFRLFNGRQGAASKMHHKFAIVDGRIALAGSYNWTLESEEQNYDNLLILREPELVKAYSREFEALWADAKTDARRGLGRES